MKIGLIKLIISVATMFPLISLARKNMDDVKFNKAYLSKKGEVGVQSLLSMNLKTLSDKSIKLGDFKNSKVFLIVNTASKCGYTSQYEGLEALHKKYKDKGLAVIGFPSNDFGAQEPGTNAEIQEFCKLNFGVTFPLMTKASVKGPTAQPFYKELLKLSKDTSDVGWNFEKFMFSSDGKFFQRYKSGTKPEDLDSLIAKML